MANVDEILVGVTSEGASAQFDMMARDMMRTLTGVDVRALVWRGKFVFVAQIGSPQMTGTILTEQEALAGVIQKCEDCRMSEVLRRPSMN